MAHITTPAPSCQASTVCEDFANSACRPNGKPSRGLLKAWCCRAHLIPSSGNNINVTLHYHQRRKHFHQKATTTASGTMAPRPTRFVGQPWGITLEGEISETPLYYHNASATSMHLSYQCIGTCSEAPHTTRDWEEGRVGRRTTRTTISVTCAPRARMAEKAAWPGVSRKVREAREPGITTRKAPMCWVIPPASPAATLVFRKASSSDVYRPLLPSPHATPLPALATPPTSPVARNGA